MARGSLAALALAAACLAGATSAWAAPEDLVLGVLASPNALPAFAASAQRATGLELAVLAEINRMRTRAGLPRLRLSRPLTNAAAFHSREMAEVGYFDHFSVDGLTFWDRIGRFYQPKRSRYWAVGENLLWSSGIEPADVITSWLRSPSHRGNLMSRLWREVGLGALILPSAPGVFAGADVTILTVDFGVRR